MDLNLIAPINSLGYGQVGTNILKALDDAGVDVSFFPISPIRGEDVRNKDMYGVLQKTMKQARTPDFDAPCLRIWHQHDMSQFVGRGPKIGFPIFELDTFTEQEKHQLNHLDKVFVCSEWAKRVVNYHTKHSNDDIHVVPLGVNTYGIQREVQSGPTRFFTCGKWEIRKGHDVLIKAFNMAFDDNDDVELHMMCDNPFLKEDEQRAWQGKYVGSELGYKVRFIPRVQSHEKVLSIMSSMDCGVFISRAEGWNLELLEMMSLGVPVIATYYSGHTEFCNEENSWLVPIDDVEAADDGIWFHGEGNWAKLGENEVEKIADHMKTAHMLKLSREDSHWLTNKRGIATGEKFTWKNTAMEIMNGINSIRNI